MKNRKFYPKEQIEIIVRDTNAKKIFHTKDNNFKKALKKYQEKFG